MTYADDRQLRADMYKAFSTRASELGSNSDWDNTDVMEQTIALRHEKAQLLGFNNYAELSLATNPFCLPALPFALLVAGQIQASPPDRSFC
jgi:Zn-dependent oligopeptidase